MVIELQRLEENAIEPVDRAKLERWVCKALCAAGQSRQSLTIKLVTLEEMQNLNLTFRGKNSPTNVLSFPFEAIAECDEDYLGDIAISPEIVKTESKQQNITFESHFAHMVIHGTLHLCGYDHEFDREAEEMASLEKGVLRECGLN